MYLIKLLTKQSSIFELKIFVKTVKTVKLLYYKKDSCPEEILSFINGNKLQDTLPN